MDLILKKCNNTQINLINLLQNNDKSKLVDFFNSNPTWATAVLDAINQRMEILELLSPNTEIMIDAGAHIGLFSLFCEPFCKQIYCLEPATKHFELLKLLTKNYSNINIFKMAIGPKTEKQVFYEDTVNNTQNSLILHNNSIVSETVDVINLPDFLKTNNINKVDLLKLDIEGSEIPLILDKSFEDVYDNLEKIYIETHNIQHGEFRNSGERNRHILNLRLIQLGFKTKLINDIILAQR